MSFGVIYSLWLICFFYFAFIVAVLFAAIRILSRIVKALKENKERINEIKRGVDYEKFKEKISTFKS